MNDELPPRLAALIAGEREAPTGDRRRVRAQLSASLGIAAASTTAAAASAIAGKLAILALAVGGGAAIAIHGRGEPSRVAAKPEVVAPAPVGHPVEVPDRAPEALEVSAPAAGSAPAPAAPPASVSAPAPAAPPAPARARASARVPEAASVAEPDPTPVLAVTPPTQRELLALAWSALSRGDNRAALAQLDRDAELHASASLDEERDALRIETLRRLGQRADADLQARAFLARFPDSIHRALVAQALVKESP